MLDNRLAISYLYLVKSFILAPLALLQFKMDFDKQTNVLILENFVESSMQNIHMQQHDLYQWTQINIAGISPPLVVPQKICHIFFYLFRSHW